MKVKDKKPQVAREIDHPLLVATYFGFEVIDAPRVTERDALETRDCEPETKEKKNYFDAKEKAALIRTYMEKSYASLPHPLAFAYKRSLGGAREYSLHLIGSQPGLGEALLIRTAVSILAEEGFKDLVVDINCIGEKESIAAYERELGNFIKKYPNIPLDLKKETKKDVFSLLRWKGEEHESIRQLLPSSIATLTSSARAYFKEVLEYIEALSIEFRLTPELVGNKNFCSHTIFAIRLAGEEDTILGMGYRYSRLTRRFGFKKEVPFLGISLYPDTKEKAAESRIVKEMAKPKFYLVQLGREAKMKTLNLIEHLRSHKIPVYHFLGKDKITAQLGNAENLRVPYLLILGHKEALEDTVTVRNMSTRAQDTIPTKDLPLYLKTIKL